MHKVMSESVGIICQVRCFGEHLHGFCSSRASLFPVVWNRIFWDSFVVSVLRLTGRDRPDPGSVIFLGRLARGTRPKGEHRPAVERVSSLYENFAWGQHS